jgi:hypothetical protein
MIRLSYRYRLAVGGPTASKTATTNTVAVTSSKSITRRLLVQDLGGPDAVPIYSIAGAVTRLVKGQKKIWRILENV